MSNIPALGFFVINKSLMKNGPKHIVIVIASITVIFCMMAVINEDATMDSNNKRGLFGWLDNQNSFSAIFWLGFICTFGGCVGFFMSLQFYSSIQIMYSYLLGPIIAAVFSVPLGIDKFPHIPSIFGLLFISLAILMVCKGNQHIMSTEFKRHALERSTVPVGGYENK